MGTTIPLPALSVKTPEQPDPVAGFQRILAMKSILGQQQLQQQQIQGATQENQMRQIQLQDQQAASQAMRDWDGKDISDLPGLYLKHGASAQAILGLRSNIVDFQQKLGNAQKTDLENFKAKNDYIAGQLDSVAQLKDPAKISSALDDLGLNDEFRKMLSPQEQAQLPQIIQGLKQTAAQGGDVVGQLTELRNHHLADSQMADLAQKQQETATSAAQQTRFTAQASEANANTAKIAGEQDPNSPFYKPTDDYLNARAAAGDPQAQAILKARATQAGAVAGSEAAAKLPYEKQLKEMELGPQPAIAVDPNTKQRVLTTLGDAQKQGLTNPIKATQTDVEKAGEFNAQANDVQMNTSRYKVALNGIQTPFSQDEVNHVARILSDPKVSNSIANLAGMPAVMSIIEQGARAADFNALPPDKQDALVGYLRMKNSAIAYQKMLTNQGRTSKEGLDIELANIPSPILGATVANKQLQAFQENIDVAAQRGVKLPWMETPADVRNRIENAPRPQPQAPQGQFTAPGGRPVTPGQQVIGKDGKLHTVTQVYRDGSYDLASAGDQSGSGFVPLYSGR